MSGTQFTLTQYGQDRLVMDWFGLSDPFDQYLPIKITNNWSGSLYFSYSLTTPPAWYSNTSGALSGSLGGAVPLGAGNNDVYQMRWSVSISGQIDKSGPNTDTLTILITAYTSGFLSGTLTTATLTIKNVLYNRYSGVIKVFGDDYSSDQPTPTLTTPSTGTLVAGASYSYAISYNKSGWESDVGAAVNTPAISGEITLTWTGVAGVSQYFIYRWSGSTDFTKVQSSVMSGTVELIAVSTGTSLIDNGIAALQTGLFRHRTWQSTLGDMTTDTGTFLSPPASKVQAGSNTRGTTAHLYQGSKNISGTTLLGPLYVTIHQKMVAVANWGFALQQGGTAAYNTSGTVIADQSIFSDQTLNWNRMGFYISGFGVTATTSGIAYIQLIHNAVANPNMNVDDVYIVANS